MTANDLAAFVTEVRTEAAAQLSRLDTIDPKRLSLELRVAYDHMRAEWQRLLTMTENEALAMHLAACEHAGRELTAEELRGLVGRQ